MVKIANFHSSAIQQGLEFPGWSGWMLLIGVNLYNYNTCYNVKLVKFVLSHTHTDSANECQVIIRDVTTNQQTQQSEITITWGEVTGTFNFYILSIQSQEGPAPADEFVNRVSDTFEVTFGPLFPGRLYTIMCDADRANFQARSLQLRTSKSKLYHR